MIPQAPLLPQEGSRPEQRSHSPNPPSGWVGRPLRHFLVPGRATPVHASLAAFPSNAWNVHLPVCESAGEIVPIGVGVSQLEVPVTCRCFYPAHTRFSVQPATPVTLGPMSPPGKSARLFLQTGCGPVRSVMQRPVKAAFPNHESQLSAGPLRHHLSSISDRRLFQAGRTSHPARRSSGSGPLPPDASALAPASTLPPVDQRPMPQPHGIQGNLGTSPLNETRAASIMVGTRLTDV